MKEALKFFKNQLTSGGKSKVYRHFFIFRPHFHQLFAKILRWSLENLKTGNGNSHKAREALKILKNQLPLPFFLAILPFLDPIFTNFLPQSAWSLENFEKSADLGPLPAEMELLPVEIPRKLVIIWKIFEKLAKKGEILQTFCQNTKVKPWKFKNRKRK